MNGIAVFDRLSLRERGHFSNHFTFDPVTRLEFGTTNLTIIRRSGTKSFTYDSLTAEVLSTYIAKGYGAAAHSYMPQTLVTITSPGSSFSFDLSKQFPDFKESEEILSLLESNVNVTKRKKALREIKRRQFIEGAVLILVLCVFLGVTLSYGF